MFYAFVYDMVGVYNVIPLVLAVNEAKVGNVIVNVFVKAFDESNARIKSVGLAVYSDS